MLRDLSTDQHLTHNGYKMAETWYPWQWESPFKRSLQGSLLQGSLQLYWSSIVKWKNKCIYLGTNSLYLLGFYFGNRKQGKIVLTLILTTFLAVFQKVQY